MSADFEALKSEIEERLKDGGFAVFHGRSRATECDSAVSWDVGHYEDYGPFLLLAQQLEAKLIVFHHRQLEPDLIDETLDRLDEVDMPEEEFAELARRLRELRVYEGFTCVVELSFDYQGRAYSYSRQADWYEELVDIAEEIDDYTAGVEDEDEGEDDMGSFFSKN